MAQCSVVASRPAHSRFNEELDHEQTDIMRGVLYCKEGLRLCVDLDYVAMPALILAVGILVIWLSLRRMSSLSARGYGSWRQLAERIVFSVAVLLAAALAGSSAFNAVALYCFRAVNPPPGAFYTVDGHRMRIDCTGSGSPTIVLESGLGNDALIWGAVQPALSKTTRVCAYDRAGLGWSEPVPGPRDARHIASDLHGLLLGAKVAGPIVLMGHSMGGLILRDYATRFPADLAGIVFVDATTPLPGRYLPPAVAASIAKDRRHWALIRSAFILGFPRLAGICSRIPPGFDAHAGRLLAEDNCDLHAAVAAAEEESIDQSGQETVHTGPFGALPILIFSQDPATMPAHGSAVWTNPWNQMQEDLKKLSTCSRRIIAKGSGHHVQIDRSDLIEKEVPPFIEQIRGTAPQPADYGTTITE
jgi:pimeloyl-ACP methyl ester carboxylesterase